MSDARGSSHHRAAEAFARQVREKLEDAVEAVVLYGSVARGEERGIDSDVDLLVVLSDDVDRADYEARVRDLAYDVELDRRVVLSLIIVTESEYRRRNGTPFFQHVNRDAVTLYG